ncbi:hypothetical protein KJ359_009650 [Pestalotiopsis sp. 9143b]|nr:hypothetical protein KJ359_009650 [Pestalotiopsis sp. 9143b]
MDRISEPDAPGWWTTVPRLPDTPFPVSRNVPTMDPSDVSTMRQAWSEIWRDREYPLGILASRYEKPQSRDQNQKDRPVPTGPLATLNKEFEAQFAEQGPDKSVNTGKSQRKELGAKKRSLSEADSGKPFGNDTGPPAFCLEWSNLDYEPQSVVLLALSRKYGSFQKACQSINLRYGQVERWLELFTAEKDQEKRWHEYLEEMLHNPDRQPREDEDPVEVKLLTRAHICNAGRFLVKHEFQKVSDDIQGWAHQTYKWPLDIDISDYNPELIETLMSPPPPDLLGFPDLVS